jgi:hypothetical protein
VLAKQLECDALKGERKRQQQRCRTRAARKNSANAKRDALSSRIGSTLTSLDSPKTSARPTSNGTDHADLSSESCKRSVFGCNAYHDQLIFLDTSALDGDILATDFSFMQNTADSNGWKSYNPDAE